AFNSFFDSVLDLSHEVDDDYKEYFHLVEEGQPMEGKKALENHIEKMEMLIDEYETLDFRYEALMDYVTYFTEALGHRLQAESFVMENFNHIEEVLKKEGLDGYELVHPVEDIVGEMVEARHAIVAAIALAEED